MANKGSSGHIKRLYAPRYFAIHRKEHKYVIKQNPGRHSLERSVALMLLVNGLNPELTRAEVGRIIRNGLVSVNGNPVKEPKFPVGLNDAIAVGSDSYLIGINSKGQIQLNRTDGNDAQLYKIIGKYKNKGNTIMLRLHDGRTIKGKNDAKVNDSVAVSGKGISKVIRFDAGAKCEVIDGVHVGALGSIKEIIKGNVHRGQSVKIESGGASFETLVSNIIVVE